MAGTEHTRKITSKMTLSIALYFIIWRYMYAAVVHIHAPENIAAVSGNSVIMSCGSAKNVTIIRLLYFRGVDENYEIVIFNGNQGLSRFSINEDDSELYQIRIENVTTSDAGIYRCVVRMSKSGGTRTIEEFKSDLIVFDSHPICNTNASSVDYQGRVGEILLLYCTVVYNGNWSPYMEWSRNDGMNVTTMFTVTQTHNSTASTLTVRLRPDDNYVTFTCKSSVTHATKIEAMTQTRKVPAYQFMWNFSAIVLFGPQRIEITPNAASYSWNDRLLCAADGNPSPLCIWTDLDANKEVGKGCLLLIDKNMTRDRVYNYQCRAENAVAGVRYYKSTNITFRILGQTETRTFRQDSIIGLAVATAAGIILLSVIVTRIRKRMKRKCRLNANKEHSTEAPSLPHDYDSIIDADIPMNQLGRDPVVVIENMEDEEENEDNTDEGDQEVGFYFNTHSTPVNGSVDDPIHESHSHATTGGNYSSLEVRPTTQPVAYIQLDLYATSVAEGYENDEQTDIVSSMQHSYYNLP